MMPKNRGIAPVGSTTPANGGQCPPYYRTREWWAVPTLLQNPRMVGGAHPTNDTPKIWLIKCHESFRIDIEQSLLRMGI